jgi:hypothetical protein
LKFAENATGSGEADSEDVYDKQGIYCRNYHSMSNSTWCAETNEAVTEEEFVLATKYYAYKNECLQPEK